MYMCVRERERERFCLSSESDVWVCRGEGEREGVGGAGEGGDRQRERDAHGPGGVGGETRWWPREEQVAEEQMGVLLPPPQVLQDPVDVVLFA